MEAAGGDFLDRAPRADRVPPGLLVSGQPSSFLFVLGFLSLSGMLIDEIELQKREGKETVATILLPGASRLCPVGMAALMTALSIIPLLIDAFWVAMAVTVIAVLVAATVLTMLVVPRALLRFSPLSRHVRRLRRDIHC